ncbi:crosslink repair DNA glycosylase YcaQ family protein [Spirillospora sp. NPDC048819]|uniref:DNA glycosylase AlkZ-like family protein n=1 Tax=Spirillospora sp. NPDC048819 TaxID=3155268 RepID=UPI0033F82D40
MRVGRTQVISYRFAAHGLGPLGRAETVLATGVQDYPPGRTASLALRLRAGRVPDAVLVHSIRAALHMHRPADLARLAAALRVEDGADLPPQSIGPFGAGLAEAGVSFGAALDEVAAAMRAAVADGRSPTKGELSGAVSPEVDRRLAPWCEGCGVFHVQDQLFRQATLQAGLVVEVDAGAAGRFRYRPAEPFPPADPLDGRAELVRGFLATFGPAKPAQLASWLGVTPGAARGWWKLVEDELRPVEVEGAKCWAHAGQIEALEAAADPSGVRLLPPYDPLTELGDRHLLVPDPARRKAVWRPAADPGIMLVDGEIAGVWRQRRKRDRLALRVEPFGALDARRREAAESDAATIADCAGASGFDLEFD